MLRDPIISSRDKLLIIILIPLVFAGMSFCYSFVGFFSPQGKTIGRLDIFGSLTPQEISGHFVFGFAAGLPFRKLRMAILCGLMALAVDADHILSAAGFEVQGRMSHSIPFTIIASVLVGTITTLILNYSIRDNTKPLTTRADWINKGANSVNEWGSHVSPDILVWNTFSQFLIITAAAVISHIAYDTFVDNHAIFPLLVPFVYTDFYIPHDSQSRGLRFYSYACGIELFNGIRMEVNDRVLELDLYCRKSYNRPKVTGNIIIEDSETPERRMIFEIKLVR